MKVTLVTASFNDLVHGTFNDKKTGCNINLMKPENASRYQRGREMSYLGELTCEKCKNKIAKEMIKADSKEMKALLKEEKMREKRGEDDGLVQLSELPVKPTSAAQPEPEPPVRETPAPAPVKEEQDDFLAQFAIKKPQETPAPAPVEEEQDDFLAQFAVKKPQEAPAPAPVEEEDDFLAQFAIKKPQEAPAPAPVEEEDDFLAQFAVKKPQEAPAPAPVEEEDDFLAQFAIKKPQEAPAPAPVEEEDDFLAQFSISAPQKETAYEEPSAPPVIDDITDALSAMQDIPVMHKEPVPEPEEDDFLSQFAVSESEVSEENTSNYINPLDDYEEESLFDSMNSDNDTSNVSEWDIIANQLFGDISDEETAAPPSIEDTAVPEISEPVIDDITVPEIEDISAPEIEDISVPEIEDIALPDIEIPEIEDISVPEIEDISAPAIDDIIEVPEIEESAEIEEIPAAEETPAAEEAPAPVKPAAPAPNPAPAPVQQAPKPSAPAAPVQPAIPPVQPMPQNIAPQPMPQNIAPQPMPQNIAPQPMPQAAPMGVPMGMGMGQIVTVPQQTGFDQNGQPVYAYMQMIFQGYDQNGQPIMMPMPQNMMGMGMGMPMQMPVPPVQQPQQQEYSSLNKNSRLQSILDSLDDPVSEKEMTVGQKIAAAEAAKGSPVSANVSKIATNPHARSTSQAFINAISDSKEDTQSLTESQGLKPKTVILDSIEDVLSQLGDNSLKEKKEREAKLQSNVPVYQEFKTPSKSSPSSSFSRPVPSSSSSSSAMSDIPLTKAQQKELKKQQKIDAKFQKEMAKRKK